LINLSFNFDFLLQLSPSLISNLVVCFKIILELQTPFTVSQIKLWYFFNFVFDLSLNRDPKILKLNFCMWYSIIGLTSILYIYFLIFAFFMIFNIFCTQKLNKNKENNKMIKINLKLLKRYIFWILFSNF